MNKVVQDPNCGGGVSLYISDTVNFEVLCFPDQFREGIYESVWTKVDFSKNVSIVIGNVYHPTNSAKSAMDSAVEKHCRIIDCIKSNASLKKCKLYLVGDYNFDLMQAFNDNYTSDYLDSMISSGLNPIVTWPTHVTKPNASSGKGSATLLDHIFTDSHSVLFAAIVINGISDHFPVFEVDKVKKIKK